MFCCSFLVFSELLVMIWGLGLRVVVRYYSKFVPSVRSRSSVGRALC